MDHAFWETVFRALVMVTAHRREAAASAASHTISQHRRELMAKTPEIVRVHNELEDLNREREAYAAEARNRALDLATKRNLMYREAKEKLAGVKQVGRTPDGAVVDVYDPVLLDDETLAVLEHMGTPVPPVDEVFPGGVTLLVPKG